MGGATALLLAGSPDLRMRRPATTAAARREGRAWMAATPHQRWTVTAHRSPAGL